MPSQCHRTIVFVLACYVNLFVVRIFRIRVFVAIPAMSVFHAGLHAPSLAQHSGIDSLRKEIFIPESFIAFVVIEHYRSWQSSLRVVPAGLYIQLTAICPSMEQVRFALPRLDIRVVAFLVRFLPAVFQYERINSVCSHERTVQVEHGAFSQWLPPSDRGGYHTERAPLHFRLEVLGVACSLVCYDGEHTC